MFITICVTDVSESIANPPLIGGIERMRMQLMPGPSLFHRPAKKAGLGTRLLFAMLKILHKILLLVFQLYQLFKTCIADNNIIFHQVIIIL